MSCIVNAAALWDPAIPTAQNISSLSEDYLIFHEAWDQLYRYNPEAGHVCHDFSKPDSKLSHPMLDTCCNNWQNIQNQNSRITPDFTDGIIGPLGLPTETLDIMLVEYNNLTDNIKGNWSKGSQKIFHIGA